MRKTRLYWWLYHPPYSICWFSVAWRVEFVLSTLAVAAALIILSVVW